jgi:hypothetical protein
MMWRSFHRSPLALRASHQPLLRVTPRCSQCTLVIPPCAIRPPPPHRRLVSSWRPGSGSSQKVDADADDEEAAREAEHRLRREAYHAEQKQKHEEELKRKAEEQAKREKEEETPVIQRIRAAGRARRRPDPSATSADADPTAVSEEPLATKPPSSTSSSSAASLPDLKFQLRRFFLQIHPDLFEAHPNEKAVNARNLAVLSDFLDALRSGGGGAPGNGAGGAGGSKTAQVVFWVRAKQKDLQATTAPQSASEAAAAAAAGEKNQQGSAATFYKISSTLALHSHGNSRSSPSSQSSSSPVASRAYANLYSSLSSLFKQAGLLHSNTWRWGEDYAAGGQGGNATGGSSQSGGGRGAPRSASSMDEEFFSRLASAPSFGVGVGSGEFESFIRSVRSEAAAYDHASKSRRHEFLLRMANLRLQGVKVIFEQTGGGEEQWNMQQQGRILDVFERTMQASQHFKPPKPIFTPGSPGAAAGTAGAPGGGSAGERVDFTQPRQAHSPGTPSNPEQPTVAFSQTVRMPEGLEGMFAQIRKHQVREETGGGAAAEGAAPAGPQTSDKNALPSGFNTSASSVAPSSTPSPSTSSFESTRSPFSRVTHVFSPRATECCIDGRGRILWALNQPEKQWKTFLNSSPSLISHALEISANFRAVKTLEKHAAERAGVYDVFGEASLLGAAEGSPASEPSAEYRGFLARLDREAHVLRGLHTVFPEYHRLTLRISRSPTGDGPDVPAAECFSVDPTMGLLLVPLHASPLDIRAAILERGWECVQIQQRHKEDLQEHQASLLHAKRHLKLRSLESAQSITRDQMREATERLSRVFGSLRDLLQGTQIQVGETYECLEEDGTIVIKWNWS